MDKPLFGPPPATRFDIAPTQEQVDFFNENGFLSVERITTDEEVAWLRGIFEHIFSPQNRGQPGGPVDRSGVRVPEAVGKLTQSFFPEVYYPDIMRTNFRRNAKRFASALLGIPEERLTSWGHMIKKSPGGRAACWHQDHAYWQPEYDYNALGVWLPMHDVSVEMGAMQFIPGSHKRGLLPHRHEDEPGENMLMVDAEVDDSTAAPCPLKLGGCTFHHSETLHYTAPNTTSIERLAFPMEFQIEPVPREVPVSMPWVEQFRAATGGKVNRTYVADGRITQI